MCAIYFVNQHNFLFILKPNQFPINNIKFWPTPNIFLSHRNTLYCTSKLNSKLKMRIREHHVSED